MTRSGVNRSVAAGLAVSLVGVVTWGRLIAANTQLLSSVPWAVPIMAALLTAWWLDFAKGWGWPRSTATARRLLGRANHLPEELWGPALGTGVLGLIATLLFHGVLARLVVLPQQKDLDPSKYPAMTVFAWVVMGALVAGVVEETALFSGGQSEWQLTASPPATIWQAGVDASFVANLAGLVAAGVATALAYRGLFRLARSAKASEGKL